MELKILGLDPGIAILGFGTIICHTSDIVKENVNQRSQQRGDPASFQDARETKGKAFPVSEGDDGAFAPSSRQAPSFTGLTPHRLASQDSERRASPSPPWRALPAKQAAALRKVPYGHQIICDLVQLQDFGVIETAAKTPFSDRLCTIYNDLHTLVDEIKPDLVAIEKMFFYRMSHTITVAQARGVLMLVLGQAGLPYVEFTPPEIKKALTGYGNAEKIEVQEAVARELALNFIPRPDDAADALAIALTAWFHKST